MERSNQPPKPECCRGEGQANAAQAGSGAEQPIGGVHREIHEPQAGVASRLSNTASKPLAAGENTILTVELKTGGAAIGKAPTGLPGSQPEPCSRELIFHQIWLVKTGRFSTALQLVKGLPIFSQRRHHQSRSFAGIANLIVVLPRG